MTPQEFVDKYLPIAEQVQSRLGFNSPKLFLAQWALETGWGSSSLCTQYNNLAGINYNGVACYRAPGGFAGYQNLTNFVTGYLHVITLDGWGYPAVLATKDGPFEEQCIALGKSDWAASHYNDGGGPGSSLIATGNSITVPSSGGSTPTSGRKEYIVKSGDTLSGIAEANGLTLAEIESYNPQIKDFNLIYPGEVVYLSPDPTVEPTPVEPTPTPEPTSPSVPVHQEVPVAPESVTLVYPNGSVTLSTSNGELSITISNTTTATTA